MRWFEPLPARMTGRTMSAYSFGADCDFKGMGVQDLEILTPDQQRSFKGIVFSFSKPVYSADSLTATVNFGNVEINPKLSAFAAGNSCTAKRSGGIWTATCTFSFIT